MSYVSPPGRRTLLLLLAAKEPGRGSVALAHARRMPISASLIITDTPVSIKRDAPPLRGRMCHSGSGRSSAFVSGRTGRARVAACRLLSVLALPLQRGDARVTSRLGLGKRKERKKDLRPLPGVR
jgi:hypothetical protein